MQATDRPLSPQERHWLESALATLPMGEYHGGGILVDCDTGQVIPGGEPIDPTPYLVQLDGLRVVGRCGCGDRDCHTVYFRGYNLKTLGTLVMTTTEAGQFMAVGFDRASGRLTELEVVGSGGPPGQLRIASVEGQFLLPVRRNQATPRRLRRRSRGAGCEGGSLLGVEVLAVREDLCSASRCWL